MTAIVIELLSFRLIVIRQLSSGYCLLVWLVSLTAVYSVPLQTDNAMVGFRVDRRWIPIWCHLFLLHFSFSSYSTFYFFWSLISLCSSYSAHHCLSTTFISYYPPLPRKRRLYAHFIIVVTITLIIVAVLGHHHRYIAAVFIWIRKHLLPPLPPPLLPPTPIPGRLQQGADVA